MFVANACRAAAPGEPPFVKEGDRVKKGQTVCIIEAMKLMNEIEVGLRVSRTRVWTHIYGVIKGMIASMLCECSHVIVA
jgi:hypothetical protein